MHAELHARLKWLSDELRAGRLDRAALFWLKVFVDAAGPEGHVRSDRWVEAGLEAARAIPGLSAAALAPRHELIARSGLFRFVRLKDDTEFSGDALEDLDWQRRYRVSLLPEFEESLPDLRSWAAERWKEIGGVAPEFAALEQALERYRPLGRAGLIEALHEAQAIFGGWLPRPALERVAAGLNLPLADVYGVTEFYDMFFTRPVGRRLIRICQDGPCAVAGADALLAGACARLGIQPGQVTPDADYGVQTVRCLGLCDRAPAALVDLQPYAPSDPAVPERLLSDRPPVARRAVGGMLHLALSDAADLETYRAQGGLAGLRLALEQLTPAQVIEQIKDSKLVGRGGAAFPTGLKWQLTANNPPGPRYVICNADESEPGAFKDRVLLEQNPFRVIEGLLIACYAVGAEVGFVYIRGEYRAGYDRLVEALDQLQAAGCIGAQIMGSGFSCRIELRRGAGAYVCGEETALMESIEGKRGFPRLKPPFPTTAGLWGCPTTINNVETLAKVPPIILYGSRWYAGLGTPESAGSKLFAVSGTVIRPGVYEVPFGVPLRHLVYDLAGGPPKGRALQAVLTGGAAGAFLTPAHLDAPLSFESFKQVGGTIGAGTIMVFDDSVDLREILARIGDFFAHESCGKCYPCQIGTQRQAEILRRVARGQAGLGDAGTLIELGKVMADASICGLGQAAALAIVSAHERWPELFEAP
ncbi:MAG TPA: NAD(P)H-dependent oxidoreductase subunit E [Roseiflexaceae bacterium]|nr:NAD(P)H-dependent oxidoreductase subunit E [Roseiflexaceae bacterium]